MKRFYIEICFISCGDGAKSVVGLFDASKAKFEFELNDFSATLAADANCGLQIGIPNTKASGMSKLTSMLNYELIYFSSYVRLMMMTKIFGNKYSFKC